MERIKQEPEESCIYKRLYLPYTVGLDKIFTHEEIDKAKLLPSFNQEFNVTFNGGIMNVYNLEDIDRAIANGIRFEQESNANVAVILIHSQDK
jgi:hypothetical protein